MAAAVNLLLYAVMLIVGLASFESAAFAMIFGKCAAHPATASWFYIATLIAIIVLNLKKNLCKKEQ